ncbi:MAG TPA: GNAT family N-acetyltransferase [Streptosporangiaceae bacterium]|nr:GNAT family N-acetyltransferase [Streptosporangiaceae bacterium]
MAGSAAESFAELDRRATARLAALDPLLPGEAEPPATPDPSAGCGLIFTAKGADGEVSATASCEHRHAEPESASLIWSNAWRFALTPALGGPEIAAPLDDLLSQWRDHLAGVPEADDEDSAAIVRWPSRDIAGIRALQRHGLAPQGIAAARVKSNGPLELAPPVPPPAGVSIRQAGPDDADVVTELNLELIRYEAHFGNLHLRPWTERALHKEATELLAKPEPWAWLAERGGTAVGYLGATRPEDAAWIASQVGLAPAAYLGEMFMRPAERGSGLAALLTGQFHDVVRAAGVPVTLLHYGVVNPLSGPFWNRQGYRPLWTTWEARPARMLR